LASKHANAERIVNRTWRFGDFSLESRLCEARGGGARAALGDETSHAFTGAFGVSVESPKALEFPDFCAPFAKNPFLLFRGEL
jgi:hypothetical protein